MKDGVANAKCFVFENPDTSASSGALICVSRIGYEYDSKFEYIKPG
jgi:hypothetical protein